jgi:hypothetical protein
MIDHRPHLLETDLRTAEDVLDWMYRSQRDETPLEDVRLELNQRLDRERRQACRRACMSIFRDACIVRTHERDWAKTEPSEVFSAENIADHLAAAHENRLAWVHEALAFRAAARGK